MFCCCCCFASASVKKAVMSSVVLRTQKKITQINTLRKPDLFLCVMAKIDKIGCVMKNYAPNYAPKLCAIRTFDWAS